MLLKVVATLQFLHLAISISTGIDANKQFCANVNGKKDQTLTVTYVSSGFQEDQLEVRLFDPQKRVLKAIIKQKEATHKQVLIEDGSYEICFKPLDRYYKLISFDFDFSDTDKGAVLAGLLYQIFEETMDSVAKDLKDAYKDMQKIAKNQHYQADRESIHQQMLEVTEKRLQYCSIGKMAVLVLICISQIYMLTGFFQNRDSLGGNV